MSEDMSERMSEDMPEVMSKVMPDDLSESWSRDMSDRMSKEMSERIPEDMSEDMSEILSKDMSERMSEDMSDRMAEDVCHGSQVKCAWVMLHKTNNFALGNAAKLMLCHLMWCTAASTWGLTFRVQASEVNLAAMSGLVVELPATIFIGTSSGFAKGVGYVWRYVLTTVGPERIYVCMEPPSTTHAGDCMFIVLQVVEGTLWHVVYEGRAVPNEEGEQRAPVFRTLASFWEVGVHEWQTNAVPIRASYTEEVQEAQWQASDFMVCTRHEMYLRLCAHLHGILGLNCFFGGAV